MSGFTFGAPRVTPGGRDAASSNAISGLTVQAQHPRLNVILKGLQKRDPQTKARSIDELSRFVEEGDIKHDAATQHEVLQCFLQLLPALVVEDERRIRQNSYNLIGQLITLMGKRSAFAMRDIAPVWATGAHDLDRVVARTAKETFDKCFTSTEKRSKFFEAFREHIVQTARTNAFHRPSESLSDPRFVKQEETRFRFANLVCSSMHLLADLLDEKMAAEVLDEQQLWSHTIADDTSIVSSSIRLVSSAFDCIPELLDKHLEQVTKTLAKIIGRADVTIVDAISLLPLLSRQRAECFDDMTRKSLSSRLVKFLEQGNLIHMTATSWTLLAETATHVELLQVPFYQAVQRVKGPTQRDAQLIAIKLYAQARSTSGVDEQIAVLFRGILQQKTPLPVTKLYLESLLGTKASEEDRCKFATIAVEELTEHLRQPQSRLPPDSFVLITQSALPHVDAETRASFLREAGEQTASLPLQLALAKTSSLDDICKSSLAESLRTRLEKLFADGTDDRALSSLITSLYSASDKSRLTALLRKIEFKNPEQALLILKGLPHGWEEDSIATAGLALSSPEVALVLLAHAKLRDDQLATAIDSLPDSADPSIILASFTSSPCQLQIRRVATDESHKLSHQLARAILVSVGAEQVRWLQQWKDEDIGSFEKLQRQVCRLIEDDTISFSIIRDSRLKLASMLEPGLASLGTDVPWLPQNEAAWLFSALAPFQVQVSERPFDESIIACRLRRAAYFGDSLLISDERRWEVLQAKVLLQVAEYFSLPIIRDIDTDDTERIDNSAETAASSLMDDAEKLRDAIARLQEITAVQLLDAHVVYGLLSQSSDIADRLESLCTDIDPLKTTPLGGAVLCLVLPPGSAWSSKWRSRIASTLDRSLSPQTLPLMDLLMPDFPEDALNMQVQRVTLLSKDLAKLTKTPSLSAPDTFHLLRIWLKLVQRLQQQNGSFWSAVIDWTAELLSSLTSTPDSLARRLVLFKLLAWLNRHAGRNDDLSELWEERRGELQLSTMRLFLLGMETTIIGDVAYEQLAHAAIQALDGLDGADLRNTDQDILLVCQSFFTGGKDVQTLAYKLLLPIVQAHRQNLVIETALTPDFGDLEVDLLPELKSLLLEAPTSLESSSSELDADLRGYLYAWDLAMEYYSGSHSRLKGALTDSLLACDKVHDLLGVVMLLLLDGTTKRKAVLENLDFASLRPIEVDLENESLYLPARLYYLCLLNMPAATRSWSMSLRDRQLSAQIESLTSKFFAGSVIEAVVAPVKEPVNVKALSSEDIEVRLLDGGREIITSYELDDQKLEMAIRLPSTYPLRNIAVEGLKRVGVKDNQWRAWILASQAVLTAQGGSVLEAIRLFQQNAKLHFEHVQECSICFSILSPENQTPSKQCATCKNLFHGSCLFKWFKSSSQSKCPLCRTSFAF
ncbi:hypothetical protein PYCC9005_003225 [Savitreella phatthalungensis]